MPKQSLTEQDDAAFKEQAARLFNGEGSIQMLCLARVFWDLAVAYERERAAGIIERYQEGHSSGVGTEGPRRYVAPRFEGNLAGLAYADAIRGKGIVE